MKVEVSAETYQVGAHFKALIKAILVAPLKSFERFFRISSFPAGLCLANDGDIFGTTGRIGLKFGIPTTHWVNLRLTLHARSSAIDTPSGARTVHVKKNASLPTL